MVTDSLIITCTFDIGAQRSQQTKTSTLRCTPGCFLYHYHMYHCIFIDRWDSKWIMSLQEWPKNTHTGQLNSSGNCLAEQQRRLYFMQQECVSEKPRAPHVENLLRSLLHQLYPSNMSSGNEKRNWRKQSINLDWHQQDQVPMNQNLALHCHCQHRYPLYSKPKWGQHDIVLHTYTTCTHRKQWMYMSVHVSTQPHYH